MLCHTFHARLEYVSIISISMVSLCPTMSCGPRGTNMISFFYRYSNTAWAAQADHTTTLSQRVNGDRWFMSANMWGRLATTCYWLIVWEIHKNTFAHKWESFWSFLPSYWQDGCYWLDDMQHITAWRLALRLCIREQVFHLFSFID